MPKPKHFSIDHNDRFLRWSLVSGLDPRLSTDLVLTDTASRTDDETAGGRTLKFKFEQRQRSGQRRAA